MGLRIAKDLGFYLSCILSGIIYYLNFTGGAKNIIYDYDYFFILFFGIFLFSYTEVLNSVFLFRIDNGTYPRSYLYYKKRTFIFFRFLQVLILFFVVIDVSENYFDLENVYVKIGKFSTSLIPLFAAVGFDYFVLKSKNHIITRFLICLLIISIVFGVLQVFA